MEAAAGAALAAGAAFGAAEGADFADFFAAAALSVPPCARKMRVGENSPNLWPTRFSVMYTGIHDLPLYTEMVFPTISGMIVEQREYVFIIFLSDSLFIACIFL